MKILSPRSARYLPAVLVILAAFLLTPPFSHAASQSPTGAKKPVSPKLDEQDLARMKKLLTAAHHFGEASRIDYQLAIASFAMEGATRKFKALDEKIWIDTAPGVGWSYFFSVSVHAVGGIKGKRPLVAFYNPWSDIFLVTAWDTAGVLPKIVDAEMLMGDWFREGSALSPVPHWLRTETFKPAALGMSVADAVSDFERIYPVAAVSDWRQQMPVLKNEEMLAGVNYPLVRLMLFGNLRNIHLFRTGDREEDPRLEACRDGTIHAVRSASEGRIESLLASADGTLPGAKAVLRKLPEAWFKTLEPVAVRTGQDGCLVFLVPVREPVSSLSLFFEGGGTGLSLKRIDVVPYRGFYGSRR